MEQFNGNPAFQYAVGSLIDYTHASAGVGFRHFGKEQYRQLVWSFREREQRFAIRCGKHQPERLWRARGQRSRSPSFHFEEMLTPERHVELGWLGKIEIIVPAAAIDKGSWRK